MPKENSYHFNLGNSDDGPLGMCARINGSSKEDALERLKSMIPEDMEILIENPDLESGEYIAFYVNEKHISEKDVDDSDEEEEPDGKQPLDPQKEV